MTVMQRLIGVVVLVLVAAGTATAAVDPELEAFFGVYEGESMFPPDEVDPRQLRVAIAPFEEDGFSVEWETVIEENQNNARMRSQVLEFQPSAANPRVFRARRGDIDTEDSTNPLDGRPFAWAHIADRVLSVHVLTVSESGDYIMQTYDRVLTRRGLTLSFVRVRNGTVEKLVWGSLARVREQ